MSVANSETKRVISSNLGALLWAWAWTCLCGSVSGCGPEAATEPTMPPPDGLTSPASAELSLTHVSPSRWPTSGGVVVNVEGTGFVSGMQVWFGDGAASNVTVDSSTALRALLPGAASWNGPLPVPVRLRLPDGSERTRSDLFSYSARTVQFGPPPFYEPSDGDVLPTTKWAVADFDRNGTLDLVIPSPSGLALVRGQPQGRFSSPELNFLPTTSGVPATGDLNNDGIPDLVIGLSAPYGSTAEVQTYFGTGDGKFLAPKSITVATGVKSLEIADVNKDNRPDILVGLSGQPTVVVLLNSGNGAFVASSVNIPSGTSSVELTTGDVNNDGKLDILTHPPGWLLYGNGMGGFFPAALSTTVVAPMLLVDVNKDGKLDLAYSDTLFAVHVALGDGTGKFGAATNYSMNGPRKLFAVDLDRDGNVDLISGYSILRGNGSGGFTPAPPISASALGYVADFTGDGWPDLLMQNGFLSAPVFQIFINDKTGQFFVPNSLSMASQIIDFSAADINKDSHADLIVINQSSAVLSVYISSAGGQFNSPKSYPFTSYPYKILTADMNQDGALDVLVTHSSLNSVSVLLGDGTGQLGSPSTVSTGLSSSGTPAIAVADVNRDGALDIVAANGNGRVLLGDKAGSFTQGPVFNVTSLSSAAVAAVDVNADGNIDLIGAGSSELVVHAGDGRGGFQRAFAYSNGVGRFNVADVTGDGLPDLVLPGAGLVLRNQGQFAFAAWTTTATGTLALTQDFDGDGWIDLAIADNSQWRILLNSGLGSFRSAMRLPNNGVLANLAAAEVYQPGRQDLILATGSTLFSMRNENQ